MDNLKVFGSSPQLKIQVDSKGGGSASYSSDLAAAVSAVMTNLGAQLAQMPEAQRPSELAVEFSLTALPEGGYAIGLDTTRANFRVSAKWGGDSASSLFPKIPT